jgi:hypothetical protein
MTAGLQSDIEVCVSSHSARITQCEHLGMRLTCCRVETLADNPAVTHQEGANRRVGRGAAKASLGQLNSSLHVLIGLGCHIGSQCITGSVKLHSSVSWERNNVSTWNLW